MLQQPGNSARNVAAKFASGMSVPEIATAGNIQQSTVLGYLSDEAAWSTGVDLGR